MYWLTLCCACTQIPLYTSQCVFTSLGMCPWYQPWLLMSAALSFSSSSSSLRSFSGGDSSRYFSLENCVEQTQEDIKTQWESEKNSRYPVHSRASLQGGSRCRVNQDTWIDSIILTHYSLNKKGEKCMFCMLLYQIRSVGELTRGTAHTVYSHGNWP